jgi:hypothetical protein
VDSAVEACEFPERLVVAPSDGTVSIPPGSAAEGEFLLSGDPVAVVRLGGRELLVRTAFRGWMMGYLVLDGAPIESGDAVAWMRSA